MTSSRWGFNVSFFAERDSTDNVVVTLSGLPTDSDNYVYLNTYSDPHLLRPTDGGVVRLDVDLRQPSLIWVQPRPGSWKIVAPPGTGDECASVDGMRSPSGEICTLTMDVVGSLELVSTDSHNFWGEGGDHDPHGPNNGRVLAQALADYDERFGSIVFGPAFGYGGADGTNVTMFTANVLFPDGSIKPWTRDWGVSHNLEPSAGTVDCHESGISILVSQDLEISEPGAGLMLVSFGQITLSRSGFMWIWGIFTPSPGIRINGPFDYTRSPGSLGLFSPIVRGDRIFLHAEDRYDRFDHPSMHCPVPPRFQVVAWRHMEGSIAERNVLFALRHSSAYDNWWDFYQAVMAADREFGTAASQHQGPFFREAFEAHGIDSTLRDFCARFGWPWHNGRYWCHGYLL